ILIYEPLVYVIRYSDLSMKEFFYHHAANGCGPGTSVTCILNENCYSDFGIFPWGKTKEDSMVFSVGVLGSASFAAHLRSRDPYGICRAARLVYRHAHALDDRFKKTVLYFNRMSRKFQNTIVHHFHKVRSVIITPICHYSHYICHLQSSYAHSSLAD